MKKTITIFAFVCLSASLYAQNVNQTIQVTNDYRSSAPEANKRSLDLSVSDTMLVFDYKFDYSVFDTPYRGSYQFSPYTVRLDPVRSSTYNNRFYARFGAGYCLHPELGIDWEAVSREQFSLSVFADASGYYGKYKTFNDIHSLKAYGAPNQDGFDFADRLGASGRITLNANDIRFEAGHEGIFAADRIAGGGYNSVFLKSSIRSNGNSSSFFFYDLGLDYRYGIDNVYYSANDKPLVGEHNLSLHGTAGPVLNERYRFLADFGVDYEYSPYLSGVTTLVRLTPRFEFVAGPVLVSAGAKLFFDKEKPFTVAPDIRADVSFFKGRLNLNAALGGDAQIASYYSLKSRNHFFVPSMAVFGEGKESIQIVRERLSAKLRADGCFRNLRVYLGGGWAIRQNEIGNTYKILSSRVADAYALFDYQLLSADAGASWISESVRADVNLHLRHGIDYKNMSSAVFRPALLSGDGRVEYNWNGRILAGLSLEASMARKMYSSDLEVRKISIPGWICPGIDFSYVFSETWTFWAKAGNLSGVSARYDLTHVQAGPYITLGATCRF